MVDALFSDLDVDITRVIGAARSKGSPNLGTITDRPRPTESPLEMAGYRLLRELGRGGMGIVYEARHPSSPKHVALKTVGPDKPDAEASLQREIRVLRSIDHPGVVRFHTAGNCDEGAFYAMDLVRGPQLAILAADPVPRRTPRRILTILRRLASTLAFVHRQGIVHGDLTPSNVLLRAADEPVLIDFGLASLSETASPAKTRETAAHEHRTFGTLAYMAPEQIRGEPVDARADLYAFGCILYETLTGHAPFTGRYRHTVRRQHLEAPRCPPSLLVPRLPALLDDLTMRLLAKVPDERPEDAGVVAAVLGSLGGKGWSEVPNTGWREVGTHFCAREAPRPHEAQRIHAGNVAPLLEEMRRRSPMRRWFA
jgi:serine/threonine protein kinase